MGIHHRGAEGRGFTELVANEQLVRLIALALESKNTTRGDPRKNVISVGQPDRGQSHYEYTLTPIGDSEGKLLGLVVLFRNVTALKELDRLKTEFVMTASHELRTPLTAIAVLSTLTGPLGTGLA